MFTKILKSSIFSLLVMGGCMQAAQSPGHALSHGIQQIMHGMYHQGDVGRYMTDARLDQFIQRCQIYFEENRGYVQGLIPGAIQINDQGDEVITQKVFYQLCSQELGNGIGHFINDINLQEDENMLNDFSLADLFWHQSLIDLYEEASDALVVIAFPHDEPGAMPLFINFDDYEMGGV